MKRLAVARFWHEGNSFSPVETGLDAFRRREWTAGAEAAQLYRGTATEMGGVLAFADRRPEWQIAFLRCAAAPPAGPLRDDAYEQIRDEILAGLRSGRWDAVYLSLHGAMLAPRHPAADCELVAAVRAAIGRVPLGASFDLHANIGPGLAEMLDVSAGYLTYPHTDMAETAGRALDLLVGVAEGRYRPERGFAKLEAVLPSFNMRTDDGPMAEVVGQARAWLGRKGMLGIGVYGGFAYGDSPDAGASVLAYAEGDSALARSAADDLAQALWNRRQRFLVELPSPEAGLAQALAAPPGTVALLDPADNPLSGGIGDTPGLLRALLRERPPVPIVFAFFCDPGAVQAAHAAGLGARLRLRLGSRLSDRFGPPVSVEATVAALTEGRFRNRGPMETGLPVDLGPTTLLDAEGIRIVVTATCQAPNDPGYFALHGIDLAATRLLCAKAKNHFRAAFGALCSAIVEVEAPGPAACDLRTLPFRNVPRHYFPFAADPGPD